MNTSHKKKEFGDFQTPISLAREVINYLKIKDIHPRITIEPTCGRGNFIGPVVKTFKENRIFAIDVNPCYIEYIQNNYSDLINHNLLQTKVADFFSINFFSLIGDVNGEILLVGNPPWVTSSELSRLNSTNIPVKYNLKKFTGLDAITGKSNFDISELIIIQLIMTFQKHDTHIAFLIKTHVARNILDFIWKNNFPIDTCEIHTINAQVHFGASVDACLFYCKITPDKRSLEQSCTIYSGINGNVTNQYGYDGHKLIANLSFYKRNKHLLAVKTQKLWRSGIKHDCSKVLILKAVDSRKTIYTNLLNEDVQLEPDYIFPLLKGTDVYKGQLKPVRVILLPHLSLGYDETKIQLNAPKTWKYLTKHEEYFKKRKSSIYKKNGNYSVFGIGKYSFSRWKIAISGLHKSLVFRIVGPYLDKPVMFDDTTYLLPCENEEDANNKLVALSSDIAFEFFNSLIFWDSMRPITAKVLNSLDLESLCYEVLGIIPNKGMQESLLKTY